MPQSLVFSFIPLYVLWPKRTFVLSFYRAAFMAKGKACSEGSAAPSAGARGEAGTGHPCNAASLLPYEEGKGVFSHSCNSG